MPQSIKSLFVLFILAFLISACAEEKGIYQDLAPDEDGVVAIEIPVGNETDPTVEPVSNKDQLSDAELDLVKEWHEGEVQKLSFLVVDVATKKIIRSYFADKPKRLASVSKIPTALTALENVRNVEVPKVQAMLKISNNGEASRYVRLAARALNGTTIPTSPYTQKHSCPDEFLRDQPAAEVVSQWIKDEIASVDWTDASLNDGAGCHYDNFMSPLQVTKILQYADQMGEAYDGKSFEDLLSINGVDGTWKNKNTEHKGYIFAKTGTLRPNANLSGYFYAKRKGVFVKHYFSVFVEKKGAGNYSVKARKLIEGLLRYWINYYSVNPSEAIADF